MKEFTANAKSAAGTGIGLMLGIAISTMAIETVKAAGRGIARRVESSRTKRAEKKAAKDLAAKK